MLEVNGYRIGFLVFALGLACIPFGISFLLRYRKTNIWMFWVLFAIWFVFFPNIPYLFSKGRYIIGYCGTNPWELCGNSWQIGFFFFHALLGVPLQYLSLRYITDASRIGKRIPHMALAAIMFTFSSIAMPIGLYGRFNSWHVVTAPLQVLQFTWLYSVQHVSEIALWFALLFGIYLLTHLFVVAITKYARAPRG